MSKELLERAKLLDSEDVLPVVSNGRSYFITRCFVGAWEVVGFGGDVTDVDEGILGGSLYQLLSEAKLTKEDWAERFSNGK